MNNLPIDAYMLPDGTIVNEPSEHTTPITIIKGHKSKAISKGFILDTDDIMILVDDERHNNTPTTLVYLTQSVVLRKLLS